MVLPGHLGGGFLIAKAILSFFHSTLSNTQSGVLIVIGTLAGELPDIDLIRYYFEQKKKHPQIEHHRLYITHAPLFWLFVCIVISCIGYLLSSIFIIALGLLILFGTWAHFLLDSIDFGVMWLWPFSDKFYAIIKKNTERENHTKKMGTIETWFTFITGAYLQTWSFWIEIFVTVLAVFVYYYFSR